MECDFSEKFSGIACKNKFWHFEGTYYLKDCNYDILLHLTKFKISKSDFVLNEKILILLRTFASLGFIGFKVLTEHEKFDNFKICAAHRYYFGVNFAQSTQCNHPNHDIKKSRTLKCFLNIDSGIKIVNIRKYVDSSLPFVMIGTGLCKICFTSISNLKFDSKVFIDSSAIKELNSKEFSKESTSKPEASAIQFGMV